jgi:uncharacterized spore protein YtfJ
MNANLLKEISETLGSTATAKSVFGDPIQIDGKIVVPVAKVAYVFGGGFGAGKNALHADRQGEGAGGGGAVRAFPAGALEITAGETRFVPFTDLRWFAAVAAGVILAGLLIKRRQLTDR